MGHFCLLRDAGRFNRANDRNAHRPLGRGIMDHASWRFCDWDRRFFSAQEANFACGADRRWTLYPFTVPVSPSIHSKLSLRENRISVDSADAFITLDQIFRRAGCSETTSRLVTEHLIDASLCGVESHGVMRTLQYVEQFKSGYMSPTGEARVIKNQNHAWVVDGEGGIGIPAMHLAYHHGMSIARDSGISALAIRNLGHTGRHGAYADQAADEGFLTICVGGGNRKIWQIGRAHV